MKELTPEVLPLPPSIVPPDLTLAKVPNRTPMARCQFGTRGHMIPLLTNHFRVQLECTHDYFYKYSVAFFYDDENQTPVEAKEVDRRVLDMVQSIQGSELGVKEFAYDGEKTLFSVGPLDGTILESRVLLDNLSSNRTACGGSPRDNDPKTSSPPPKSKTCNVEISYVSRIPMKAIFDALQGHESEQSNEAVRVLDVLLRQHAAKQGRLFVPQYFFHNDLRHSIGIGGGVVGCRSLYSKVGPTQSGLSLNMDVSTAMIIKPGKVLDFVLQNQNVRDIWEIDWTKARRILKSLRIKTFPSNLEHKITGLSEKPCIDQKFIMKRKNGNDPCDTIEITVYDYYLKHRNIELKESKRLPCLDVGKPKRPIYIPLELCELITLQRYTKSLSNLQRTSLVKNSSQMPHDRMKTLMDALNHSNYNADPLIHSTEVQGRVSEPQKQKIGNGGDLLALNRSNYNGDPFINSTGITISTTFTEVEGRVLEPPKLRIGNGGDLLPRNGRWNFINKTLVEPTQISEWAIVNFSARCSIKNICRDLIRCSRAIGMSICEPSASIEENYQYSRSTALFRVEKMFVAINKMFPVPPLFLLCVLPKKNSDIYGPWKKKCLVDFGIVNQCIAPSVEYVHDQYLTNLALKINSKMGGMNSLLSAEYLHSIPLVSKTPTIIFGIYGGSPGRSDVPSIAAIVSSRQWPLISRYRASVRAQYAPGEMIDGLFKPVSGKDEDEGIIREHLDDFYTSTGFQLKPQHIIIFRDGVSERQFNQVLNIELEQIMEACKFLDETWDPKFTMIVAQKTHHTKFFQQSSDANVPPGTIIDDSVCHPKNNDFYLCAQNGTIGTTRPTHYHVLLDQIGFSADDLQELVHALSYVQQRSTTAISVVAPISYAHLAAQQMSQLVKYDDMSDAASSHSDGAGCSSSGGGAGFTRFPKLHENVCNSMFFC